MDCGGRQRPYPSLSALSFSFPYRHLIAGPKLTAPSRVRAPSELESLYANDKTSHTLRTDMMADIPPSALHLCQRTSRKAHRRSETGGSRDFGEVTANLLLLGGEEDDEYRSR